MAHELQAPWSWTLDDARLDVGAHQDEVPAVGLHRRAHEVHDPLELGQAIGPLVVGQSPGLVSVTPPFCRAERGSSGRPPGPGVSTSAKPGRAGVAGLHHARARGGTGRGARACKCPARAHTRGFHEDPGCVQRRDGGRVRYPAGSTIFEAGESGEEMFGIIEGGVELRVPGDRAFEPARARRLLRGDGAGRPLTPQRLRRRAFSDTTLAVIDRRRFLFLVGETPNFRAPGDGEHGRAHPQHALTAAGAAGVGTLGQPDRLGRLPLHDGVHELAHALDGDADDVAVGEELGRAGSRRPRRRASRSAMDRARVERERRRRITRSWRRSRRSCPPSTSPGGARR